MRKKTGIFWCLLLATALLWGFGFYYGSVTAEFGNCMSVRYETGGLTSKQLEEFYQDAKEGSVLPSVTGWKKEGRSRIVSPSLRRSTEGELIEVWGEMEQVMPQQLDCGAFVSREDGKGCVITAKTAEDLFRSKQAAGEIVTCKGKEYVVRGVIRSQQPGIMVVAGDNSLLPNLELVYQDKLYPGSQAKALLSRLGLGEYSGFMEGNLYGGIAGVFMCLPFLTVIFWSGSRLLRERRKEAVSIARCLKYGIAFLLVCVLALLVLRGRVAFSQDYLPPGISDLDFWSAKAGEAVKDFKMLANYQGWYKESMVLGGLKKCAAASVTGCVTAIFALRRIYSILCP